MIVKNSQLYVGLFVFCSDDAVYYTPAALFVCLPAARGALHPAMTMKLWWWTMSTRSASPRSASYRQMLESKRRTHTRDTYSSMYSVASSSDDLNHIFSDMFYLGFRCFLWLAVDTYSKAPQGVNMCPEQQVNNVWQNGVCWQDRLHSLCSAVTCLRGSLWEECSGQTAAPARMKWFHSRRGEVYRCNFIFVRL